MTKPGMKVQCPKCREIVVMEAFSTSAEGLRFKCDECGEIVFLPNPANLKVGEADSASAPEESREDTPSATHSGQKERPPMTDPEASAGPDSAVEGDPSFTFDPFSGGVDSGLQGDVICPKCGHSQSDSEDCHRCGLVFSRFDPMTMPPDPEEAAEIWRHVARHPEDLSMHDHFIEACHQADRLDYARRQYNLLARKPGLTEVLDHVKPKIQSLISAELAPLEFALPPTRPASGSRGRKLAWTVVILAVAAWFAFLGMSSLKMF